MVARLVGIVSPVGRAFVGWSSLTCFYRCGDDVSPVPITLAPEPFRRKRMEGLPAYRTYYICISFMHY